MSTPDPTAARVVLLERRDTPARRDPGAAPVGRYRLARVRLDGAPGAGRGPARAAIGAREPGRAQRLARLRRTYD